MRFLLIVVITLSVLLVFGVACEDDAGRPRVSANLKVAPRHYVGTCPVPLMISGEITLEGGSGTVYYQLVQSHSSPSPSSTLTFDSPGTQDFSLSRDIIVSESGWVAIKILAPEELESNRAEYAVTCRP